MFQAILTHQCESSVQIQLLSNGNRLLNSLVLLRIDFVRKIKNKNIFYTHLLVIILQLKVVITNNFIKNLSISFLQLLYQ